MAQGNADSMVPINAELTIQQAAVFLDVSRPHVVRLLQEKRIAFRTVGADRRVAFKDLMDYKQRSMAEAGQAADELTKQAQELSLGY